MIKRIAFVFFLLFYANLLIGQENPHPFVRNFLPVEYGGETQSWALEQDTLGSIYLGGNTGIHVFNGTQWSKIEFPTEDVCRSLKKAKNGRVYAGTVGDFGYINVNNKGELVYESLIYLLDSADKVFTDVWSIKTHENKVYFHTNQSIYIYNYEEPIDSLKISILDTDIFVIAEVNGNILVEVKDGFFKIQGDSLVSIDKKIYPWIMLSMSANHTFILDSEAKRARVFNDNEWIDVSTEYFTNKKATEIYTQLVEEQCYSSLVWKDSLLIFGTLSSGILVMDKAGNFIETINEDFGLENSSIMTLFIDNREQIWAGTSNGLSYIEYNSPIKKWNKNDGIVGAIYGVSRLENKLHVYTNLGIYQLDGQKFEPIPELSDENAHQVFTADVFDIPDYGQVSLISSSYGVWELKGKNAKHRVNAILYYIIQSKYNKKRFYYSDENYFVQFDYSDSIKADTIYEFSEAVDFLNEYPKDNFWFLSGGDIIKLVRKNNTFKLSDKLILNNITFVDALVFNNKLYFTTKEGIYTLKDNKIIPDTTLIGDFYNQKDVEISTIDSLPNRNLVAIIKQRNAYRLHLTKRSNNKIEIDSFLYNRIPELDLVYPESNEQIFATGTKAVYSINLSQTDFLMDCPIPLVKKLVLNQDSTVFLNNKNIELDFDYQHNDIEFYFSLAFYDFHENNQYSYSLEGSRQNTWSAWSTDFKKEFSNLREGSYVLRLKSKNVYNKISPITELKFQISPPYYRTSLAYAIYVLLAIGLVLGIIKIYTRKLKAENDRLEDIVKLRTAEISQQNEEIIAQSKNLQTLNNNITFKNAELTQQKEEILTQAENMQEVNILLTETNKEIVEQKEEIDKKNRDILASIKYAKRIQKAVLHIDEDYKKTLPEHFIFLKPRDIVSGDFYFIRNVEQMLGIAAVDCTGHGVPGAFMSMLGTAFLTDIVHNRSVKTTSDILGNMRNMVKESLNQYDNILTSKDGMDMALLGVNMDTLNAQFSGAHNPLFLFRNGKLTEYKGDPMPIGIFRKERPFTNHLLKLEKGDVIYLFSDGFYDQFGGPNGRKYNKSNFKNFLSKIHQKTMAEQHDLIMSEYNSWVGKEYKQLDDILIMGFRF